ncbi:TPA: hypothetical protein ACU9T0_001054 [Burkholderia cenocepacia]
MENIDYPDDFPSVTIDQIRDLAAAVQEDFGPDLSRIAFADKLLLLLEDVAGFNADPLQILLIDSAWTQYSGRCSEN